MAGWRKAKLEHYRQYVAALWGMVQGKAITADAQARYADAVNTLTLVAPPSVLRALYAFQDEISYRNTQRSDERHDQLVNVLLRQMRRDVRPPAARRRWPRAVYPAFICAVGTGVSEAGRRTSLMKSAYKAVTCLNIGAELFAGANP